MKEKDVWAQFKKKWPYHCERQEPGGGFDAGKPDVLLQDRNGMPGLIELKAPTRLQLRPSQWIWHERWATPKGGGRAGRSCVVTCEVFDGFRDPLWTVCPIRMKDVLARKILVRNTGDWSYAIKRIGVLLGLKTIQEPAYGED